MITTKWYLIHALFHRNLEVFQMNKINFPQQYTVIINSVLKKKYLKIKPKTKLSQKIITLLFLIKQKKYFFKQTLSDG